MLIRLKGRGFFALVALLGGLFTQAANALPSYASQTGAACGQCHTVAFGPALTPFGQQFKLNGYSWGSPSAATMPFAAMVVASFNNTQQGQAGGAAPHFADNDNLAVDQTSLFYGGRITQHSGAFVQATYDGIARHAAWDNLDIRYANQLTVGTTKAVYGVTLNNNPTVQDLWNSTPAWAFPYESSGLAPAPAAAPLIEGALAQQVLGVTAYTMIADTVYIEGGAYKTLPQGTLRSLGALRSGDSLSAVNAPAPYWRLVLQNKTGAHYLSAGLFGMSARLDPGGNDGRDRYTDLGYDATWQFNNGGALAFNANLTYVHELQNLAASAAAGDVGVQHNQINTFRLNAGAVYAKTYSLSGGPFTIHGGTDSTLYGPGDIGGSANGSPNSRGYVGQIEFVPFGKTDSWLRPFANARLGLQYTYYTQFNGSGSNYDGAGRSARDNNTLFGFLWLAI